MTEGVRDRFKSLACIHFIFHKSYQNDKPIIGCSLFLRCDWNLFIVSRRECMPFPSYKSLDLGLHRTRRRCISGFNVRNIGGNEGARTGKRNAETRDILESPCKRNLCHLARISYNTRFVGDCKWLPKDVAEERHIYVWYKSDFTIIFQRFYLKLLSLCPVRKLYSRNNKLSSVISAVQSSIVIQT